MSKSNGVHYHVYIARHKQAFDWLSRCPEQWHVMRLYDAPAAFWSRSAANEAAAGEAEQGQCLVRQCTHEACSPHKAPAKRP